MNLNRDLSIDALRGIAIIGMVFSGTIARHIDIPNWMFHAQVGPPDFIFNPNNPGITWVDLVFPFFLFAMGLSFPFSMNRFLDKGGDKKTLFLKLIKRSFQLFIFAVALPHLTVFAMPDTLGFARYIFSFMGFITFYLMFSAFPQWKKREHLLNKFGYIVLVGLLFFRSYVFGLPFSVHHNDIIILVMANMVLVAPIIWVFTRHNWWVRLAIVCFFIALHLTSSIENSINYQLYHFTPLKFMGNLWPAFKATLKEFDVVTNTTIFYNMNFLKYLFIVIPGTIIGDIIYKNEREKGLKIVNQKSLNIQAMTFAIVLLGVLIVNLIGLYMRNQWLLFFGNLPLIFLAEYLLKYTVTGIDAYIKKWLRISFVLLILGLLLEPLQGGIKKDSATISYFFVTSGLSGLLLLSLKVLFHNNSFDKYFGFLPKVGQNPMVGYVAVAFLILPIFGMLGCFEWINKGALLSPYFGVLKGVALTSLMILITLFTVKIKNFWKT